MTDIVALGRPHPRESPLQLAQERAVYFPGAKSRQKGRGSRFGRCRCFSEDERPALSGRSPSLDQSEPRFANPIFFAPASTTSSPASAYLVFLYLLSPVASQFFFRFKFVQLLAASDYHGQNKPHSPPGATDSTQPIRQWKDQQTATMGRCGRRDPSC